MNTCLPECRVILDSLQKATDKMDDRVRERLKIRHFQWVGGLLITVLCLLFAALWRGQNKMDEKLDFAAIAITRIETTLANHSNTLNLDQILREHRAFRKELDNLKNEKNNHPNKR